MATSKATFKRASPTHNAARGRPSPRTKRAAPQLKMDQVHELLLQALETELGGVEIYETAVECAVNEDLREEWEKYLDQTRNHVEVVTRLCESQGIDVAEESPGRQVVRQIGSNLVMAMRMALESGDRNAAQLVAAECVVLGENKDHQNWELLGEVAKRLEGDAKRAFQAAVDEVEDEEDEHLYHTMGWSRELWIESLGIPAVLPPPEEKRKVKTAIGAAKAKGARGKMAKKKA